MVNSTIELINLVPKFVTFLEKSKKIQTMDGKWELWKTEYNFAAIPPTEAALVQAKLDFVRVYQKYLTFEHQIKEFYNDEETIKTCILALRNKLDTNCIMDIKIVYFVGFFENNPFVTTDANGKLCVCLPIENNSDEEFQRIQLYHELTHIYHSELSNTPFLYERPLSFLILQEGLALRMSEQMVPGHADSKYVSHQSGWYEKIDRYRNNVISGIIPDIHKKGTETLYKYTMGKGNTGYEREAYYIGWILVGKMLDNGYSFRELMIQSEEEGGLLVEKYLAMMS